MPQHAAGRHYKQVVLIIHATGALLQRCNIQITIKKPYPVFYSYYETFYISGNEWRNLLIAA